MEKLRIFVWKSLLTADLSQRYYGHLADRYRTLDAGTKIFLAVMSSGAVAGWAIWTDAQKYPFFVHCWKWLSGMSALLAVAMPILNFPKKREYTARLAAEYIEIVRDYDLLWLNIDQSTKIQIVAELKKIWQKETKLTPLGKELSENKKGLIKLCQKLVVNSRGLSKEKPKTNNLADGC